MYMNLISKRIIKIIYIIKIFFKPYLIYDIIFSQKTLQFNRSVADGGNAGINQPSSFLDGSIIYGNRDADLRRIRDYGNRGKMILITDTTPDGSFGFPPIDDSGNYIYGYSAEFGRNVFTDFFHING